MADWYNDDWGHRFKITSDNTKVTNSNDVLYYDISNAPEGFWSKVRSDGGDIRVTKADGTSLVAREISGFEKVTAEQLVDDVVAYYTFDETSGHIQDSTENNHHSTSIAGTPLYSQTGIISDSIDFSGSEVFSIAHHNDFDFGTGDFTANVWLAPSEQGTYLRPVGKFSTVDVGWSIQRESDNKWQVRIRQTSSNSHLLKGTSTTALNKWQMVTLVREGDTLRIYVDGELENTKVDSTIQDVNVNNNARLRFGAGEDGVTWTTSGTAGSTTLRSVAWSPELELFAVVGNGGAVRWSVDGKTWTTSGTAGSATLRGVAWSPELELFVAVGLSGAVRWSEDGKTWTTSGTAGSTTLEGIAWSPELELFVAVGHSGAVRWSEDGKTWTTSGTAGSTTLEGIAWSPELELFVAVGNGGAVRWSEDGKTWTTSGTAGSTNLWDIAWSPELELFVAVGDNGAVRWSVDGKTWTTSGAGSTTLRSVAWSPELELFAAVGHSGAVRWSEDGAHYKFKGKIDEALIADRAYSAKEIEALYNLQKNGFETGQFPFVDSCLGALWFKADGLSTSTNTDFFLYYDNDSATEPAVTDTYGRNNVWTNFEKVFHLDETCGTTAVDSTGNVTGAISNATLNQQGLVSNSYLFNANGNVAIGAYTPPTVCTFTANIKLNDLSNEQGIITGGGASTGLCNRYTINYRTDGKIRLNTGSQCPSARNLHSSIDIDSTEEWYRITVIFDRGTFTNSKILINGIDRTGTFSTNGTPTTVNSFEVFHIAKGYYDGTSGLRGKIDEVRVISSTVSENYELTAYNNESDNASFWTTGTEEAGSFAVSGTVNLQGSPVEGANVTLLKHGDSAGTALDSFEDEATNDTTDASGEFSFEGLNPDRKYAVLSTWTDNDNRFRSQFKPFLEPKDLTEE